MERKKRKIRKNNEQKERGMKRAKMKELWRGKEDGRRRVARWGGKGAVAGHVVCENDGLIIFINHMKVK